MSFQPLQDPAPDKSRIADLGLLVIRLLSAATFVYYQLASQLGRAFKHVWDGTDWELAAQLAERGLPVPGIVAAVAVALLAATLLGVALGFFTRFNALVFALLTGFVLISAIILSPTLNPQALALYLTVFAGFACGGGGRLSLDHLLAGRRVRREAA